MTDTTEELRLLFQIDSLRKESRRNRRFAIGSTVFAVFWFLVAVCGWVLAWKGGAL